MKITIIYDNTSFDNNLESDWGFSALIEAKDTPRILFDTGTNGKILLDNMSKLDIDPLSIEEVFISHAHYDHVGGLKEFLKKNNKVKIYIPPSFAEINSERSVAIDTPQWLHTRIFSTGELEGIEQSMGITLGHSVKDAGNGEKNIVLVVGCSHPYMGNILETASSFGKVWAVIGGMHGFSDLKLFRDLKWICPTHCTQHQRELKQMYPEKYLQGGAGRIIEL